MKRHGEYPGTPRARRSGSEVSVSQSRKWLTERLAPLPQVSLVFDEQLPQFLNPNENFVDL
jgi:hypothetical protein